VIAQSDPQSYPLLNEPGEVTRKYLFRRILPEVPSSDMHFSEDVPVPSPEEVHKKQLSHNANCPPIEMSGEAAAG